MAYEVDFRRSNLAIVFSTHESPREVSLLGRRGRDDRWHCPLCDSTDCRHTRAAEAAARDPSARGA